MSPQGRSRRMRALIQGGFDSDRQCMIAGSKLMDAQAAYESSMIMQSVLLACGNDVFRAACGLEGGLSASFAKSVLETEQMEMDHRLSSGVDIINLDDALEAVCKVGPGGHFLGTAHTLARFETRCFAPKRLDNTSLEQRTAPIASSRW